MAIQPVLVTAGAAGVGREIAAAFIKQGAAVFICAAKSISGQMLPIDNDMHQAS